MLSRLSATDVNQQDDADERDRTGDADHTICAYTSTKKSYFKSLRLCHGSSPSGPDSPAEPDVGIRAIPTGINNSNHTCRDILLKR
jgi:hypothetical protein